MSSGVLPTAAKAGNPGCVTETLFAYQHKDHLEEDMASHSSIPPRESQGQKSLAGYSPWGCKELDRAEVTAHMPT